VQSLNNKKLNIDVLLTYKTLELDVLCITEHWLEEKEIGYYNFVNYSLVSKFCRKNKQQIKNNLEIYKKQQFVWKLNSRITFWASITELTQYNTVTICVYRTPNSNINIFIETMDTIISNLLNKGKSIIIVGDLNRFLRKWSKSTTTDNVKFIWLASNSWCWIYILSIHHMYQV
jgi:hypothetical protein